MNRGEYYWDKTDDGKQDVLVVSQTWLAKLLGKPVVIIEPCKRDVNTK